VNPTAAMIAKDSDEQYRFLYIDPNAHHHGEVEESIKLLFGTNYVLDYAASLEEAYPLIITKNYHLLISELDLPEGVGLQNLQCLKSWCGFSPTLIFTHLDDKDKALESVRMGATDYMIKGRGDANTLKRVIQYSLERAKIQNALHHNEELLRIFIQHTPAAIAMFDRDMNYIMASKRWLHDYSINEDVLGKNHYEVFDIPERWKIIHRQCLNGAIHKSEQDSFIGRQGVPEYIRWEVHPWYQGSNVGGLVMFTEVISDKVRMQRELEEAKEALEEKVWQRTQALEKAMQNAEMMNQSRVELFTNLTHELRTPLHAIINFSQFGLDKFNGASEEKLKGYYANINKSGHRLLRLVNDILDLAKVQSINIQLEPQHVTFNAIMQDALSEIQSLADQKGIRLCFDYEEDVTVYADAPRILQVPLNSARLIAALPSVLITGRLNDGSRFRVLLSVCLTKEREFQKTK
jgi:PAS domain-containing protein